MTIVITARGPGTLTVAGALRGEAIGALEAAALALPAGARLDLTDLRGIDETGEALLRRLRLRHSLVVQYPVLWSLRGRETFTGSAVIYPGCGRT